MAKGGARPGAGRKKGHKASHTVEAEAAKARLVAMFVEKQQAVYDALFKQILIQGNMQAIKELFERVWGKVPATIDPGDGDMEVFQFVIKRKDEAG